MSFAGVRISLLSAPDDPPVQNGALQSTFGKFRQFLRICDIPISTPMFYQDIGAAEGYAGEFIVPLPQTRRRVNLISLGFGARRSALEALPPPFHETGGRCLPSPNSAVGGAPALE